MFGLTFEKLFLVAVLAGVVVGPRRLPGLAQQLADWVRALRELVDSTRARAETDLGLRLTREEWEALDVRRYDPRSIVREALHQPSLPEVAPEPELLAQARSVRPGQRYLVTGSAAHPRRLLIASLPPDDPRRLAAESGTDPEVPTSMDGTGTNEAGSAVAGR